MNLPARNLVFVLESDPVLRQELCSELIRANLNVREYSAPDTLLAALADKPAVCILPIDTPTCRGLDICRQLREQGDEDAHVIFSANIDNIQLRLSAFDAGGNDYSVKPLVPEEITRKIGALIKNHAQLAELSSSLHFANTAAFSAMSTMAEMGTVMSFMRAVFECQSAEDVAAQIMDACRQYDLQSLVAVQINNAWIMRSAHGNAGPLEQSLLEHARRNDRITQFAGRLSISYPSAILLITNWPKEDEDRAGRLRDHLAFVAEAAHIRLTVLQHDAQRLESANTILNAISGLRRMVDYLRERQSQQRDKTMRMVAEQGEAIAMSFYSMGLSDSQESTILSLVSACGGSICKEMEGFGLEQERMLEGIIETMNSLTEE
jgi:DNA-binding response OmpR family regulator